MTCIEVRRELVETARAGRKLRMDVRQHVTLCVSCSERWELERELTRGLQTIRAAAERGRMPAPARSRLAVAFTRARRRAAMRRSVIWGLAAAAALVFAILAREGWNYRGHDKATWVAPQTAVISQPANGGEYVSIPYALPLSPGEIVSVVRAEVPPSALVRMGFPPIHSATTTVSADFVVGEDGLPRAVRLVNDTEVATFN